MKIIIIGQPRSGKSRLAQILKEELDIPIICTDKYRREWGYHEPWKGYETEIRPENQLNFYNKLLELLSGFNDFILEGSAIYPKDIHLFNIDACVLLARTNINASEMLEFSRKYDTDWTINKEDEYLLKLFENYYSYSLKWAKMNHKILVDTSKYHEGLEQARNKIIEQLKNKRL